MSPTVPNPAGPDAHLGAKINALLSPLFGSSCVHEFNTYSTVKPQNDVIIVLTTDCKLLNYSKPVSGVFVNRTRPFFIDLFIRKQKSITQICWRAAAGILQLLKWKNANWPVNSPDVVCCHVDLQKMFQQWFHTWCEQMSLLRQNAQHLLDLDAVLVPNGKTGLWLMMVNFGFGNVGWKN